MLLALDLLDLLALALPFGVFDVLEPFDVFEVFDLLELFVPLRLFGVPEPFDVFEVFDLLKLFVPAEISAVLEVPGALEAGTFSAFEGDAQGKPPVRVSASATVIVSEPRLPFTCTPN